MKYVKDITGKLLKPAGRKRGFFETVLLERWYEIFPSYAAFMRPVKVWKGCLVIATNSPSAAHNVKMQGPYIIARINQFMGYDAVTSLKFQVKYFPVKREEEKKNSLKADALAVEKAHEKCAHIKDEELRKSFQSLTEMVEMEKRLNVS